MVCISCKNDLPVSKFPIYKHSGKPWKKCKSCRNKILIAGRMKRRKIPGSYDWLRKRYDDTRYRAKHFNREFSLTMQEFTKIYESLACGYCGAIHNSLNPIHLDRVNNQGGYTLDNVKLACKICNSLKQARTKNDILKEIRRTNLKLQRLNGLFELMN